MRGWSLWSPRTLIDESWAIAEESVAEFPLNASVPQLRRALSRYSFDPDSDSTDAIRPAAWNGLGLAEDRASAPAELSMGYDQWGRFTLRFSAPADAGALVEAALDEAKDALFRAGRLDLRWVTFSEPRESAYS